MDSFRLLEQLQRRRQVRSLLSLIARLLAHLTHHRSQAWSQCSSYSVHRYLLWRRNGALRESKPTELAEPRLTLLSQLGSATALSNAGPLGLLLGYAFMSLVTWIIALISAETSGFLPVSGGFIRHVPMFTNESLGTTCGYVFTYLLAITAPAEVCRCIRLSFGALG